MIRLAVIGDPIDHSLSPLVHSTILKNLGIDYEYEKVQVKKGELGSFLEYAKEKKFDGFNLTMPHKVDILPYLWEIDEEAERYGAVNTVKVKDGKLYGYNTDADGYVQSIKTLGIEIDKKNVVIMGAGGVVQTLALKTAIEGANEISIMNRTLSKAEEISKMVEIKTGKKCDFGGLEVAQLKEKMTNCHILINATPLGMHSVNKDFEDLSFINELPKEAVVSDLIYNPQKTTLLKKTEQLGYKTINGLGMLVFQAILADKIYLESDFDINKVYNNVIEKILSVI